MGAAGSAIRVGGVWGEGGGVGAQRPFQHVAEPQRPHVRTQTSGGVHWERRARQRGRGAAELSRPRDLAYSATVRRSCSARSQWCLTGPSESVNESAASEEGFNSRFKVLFASLVAMGKASVSITLASNIL